jgi:hypothetical protein
MTPLSAAHYRPFGIRELAPSLLYSSHTGRLHDLYYESLLAATLRSWDTFETLDSMLFSHLGLTDFGRAGRHVRVFGRGPERSAVARGIVHLLGSIQRQQVTSLSTRPAFVRLRAVLEDLVHEGILVSADDLLAQSAEAAALTRVRTDIAFVGVVTRDRPESLGHCVRSYLDNARLFDRRIQVVVIDRSTAQDVRRQNRDRLSALADEYGSPVAYADESDLQTYAEALVQRGLPRGSVEFALTASHDTAGDAAALNGLLLHTSGACLMVVGDTSRCEAIPHPDHRSTLLITQDPCCDSWIVDGRPRRPRRERAVKIDVLALHEAILGQPLDAVVAAFRSSSTVTLGRLCDHLDEALVASGARIVASCTGSLAPSTPERLIRWLACVAPAAGSKLARVDATGRQRHGTPRSMIGLAPEYLLSHRADSLGADFALDNRTLLPPFVCCGRDRDALFRLLVTRLMPHAYFVDLPWATPSTAVSPTDAAGDCGPVRPEPALPFASVLSASLSLAGATTEIGDLSLRLARAGRQLAMAASLPEDVLVEQLRPHLCRVSNLDVRHWQTVVRESGDRGAAAGAARAQIACRDAALTASTFPAAAELLPDCAPGRRGARTQQLLGDVGRLLHAWPDIVSVSQGLKDAGMAVAAPL